MKRAFLLCFVCALMILLASCGGGDGSSMQAESRKAVRASSSMEDTVQKAYIAYYGRPADTGGLAYWAGRLEAAGGDLAAIMEAFGTSQEFTDRFGSMSTSDLVNQVYQQLFNRDADSGGLSYYSGLIDGGSSTLQSITLQVMDGAQNDDISIVANKLNAANRFTSALSNGFSYGTEESASQFLAGVGADFSSVITAMQGYYSDNGQTYTATPVSGVVVDPYIEGAVFCFDLNSSGTCDEGEPQSSSSDELGNFSFDEAPADGTNILMQFAGTHNGVPYSYNKLAATYSGGNVVVSPISTLGSKGLTAEELAQMFQFAGLADVSADQMLSDPMSGLTGTGGEINLAKLAALRSSLASYMFLRIAEGSTELAGMSALELYTSAMDTNGAVYAIMSTMATNMNQALSGTVLEILNSNPGVAMVQSMGLPEVVFDDVVKVAVAISDRLGEIGYTTCNATSGDAPVKAAAGVEAVQNFVGTSAQMQSIITELGTAFYLARIGSSLSEEYIEGVAAYNASYGDYMNCSSRTFVLNADKTISCYQ